MSFLSPLFLAGLAAAAVPILLHFLRRQPQVSVKFPAVRLLRQSPVEQASRRRLRELLLLALRVGALVLLSVAFARPFFAQEAGTRRGGVTVVALDTSLSLSAPGRMAAAQAAARLAIDAAPSGHVVGVVTFADTATVAAEPAGDRGLARSAIADAQAGAGGTRYRAVLEAAGSLVTAHGDGTGRIVVVTDLQAGGWDQGDRVLLPEGIAVEIADVGPLPDNLAIVRVRAEGERRVVATVANFSEAAREARVTVLLKPDATYAPKPDPTDALKPNPTYAATADGRQVGEQSITIGAGQTVDVEFDGIDAGRTPVSVEVVDPDGLQGDNARYVVMGSGGPPPVLIVTATGNLDREAFYARQALAAAGPAGAAFGVEGAAASALASWEAAAIDGFRAVVLLSTRGLDRRGRDLLTGFLQRGGGLLMAVGPDVDGEVAAGTLGGDVSIAVPSPAEPRDPRGTGRALVPIDARHPVFRTIGASSIGAATFGRVAGVQSDGCPMIARFTTGEPAVLDCARGDGRALVFASDLDHAWNTLPRHAAFVPFLHESIRYLAGGRAAVVDGVDELIVGRRAAAESPGVITLPGPAGAERVVAVNVDPGESEPSRMTPEAFLDALSTTSASLPVAAIEARQQEDRQHIWRYALLLMIAMLIAESALASRAA